MKARVNLPSANYLILLLFDINEPFVISAIYQGREREFKVRFERWGYTHHVAVHIVYATVNFEPDDERGYRALAFTDGAAGGVIITLCLLEAIAEQLTALIRKLRGAFSGDLLIL